MLSNLVSSHAAFGKKRHTVPHALPPEWPLFLRYSLALSWHHNRGHTLNRLTTTAPMLRVRQRSQSQSGIEANTTPDKMLCYKMVSNTDLTLSAHKSITNGRMTEFPCVKLWNSYVLAFPTYMAPFSHHVTYALRYVWLNPNHLHMHRFETTSKSSIKESVSQVYTRFFHKLLQIWKLQSLCL